MNVVELKKKTLAKQEFEIKLACVFIYAGYGLQRRSLSSMVLEVPHFLASQIFRFLVRCDIILAVRVFILYKIAYLKLDFFFVQE